MRLFRTAPLLVLAASLAACGGGSGDTPPAPEPLKGTTVFPVAASSANSGIVWGSGSVETAPDRLFVGEVVNEARLFVTFFLGAIQNREVVSCALRLAPESTLGDPTAPPLGGYVAERVDVGAGLDGFDWSEPALTPASPAGPGVWPVVGGYFELDVAQALRDALAAGHDRITLRVRLASNVDMDGAADGFWFYVADPAFAAMNPLLMLELRDL